ncbi:hypothetical protein CFP65_4213 [Kitasatospora sp. MMS16-BH015]|uniref:thioesterase II family protein n=1 Tax=Kitasatospora sp. MMS16-BH015 TaxID=2018025 RepID=UPI000CA0D083|nr:alpha/beta fold hydrolase [Kitasatospora sp. MMS16-BH015]AUG78967.1 hypothetical protein CFP65_4213 [Kitasatospora sp. MMS16-BH015]
MSQSSASRGLRVLREATNPEAPELTLLLMHHAGGSAVSWVPFESQLPADWRVVALELPARVTSPAEPGCRSTMEAVHWLKAALGGELTGPYAIFGHSMGALVAYELARALEWQGNGPCWLGVSGLAAPRLLGGGERRDYWSQDQLVDFMRDLGGIPESAFRSPALVSRMVRTLRRDLAIVDSYQYSDCLPLRTPISVFSGAEDDLAGPSLTLPWSSHTSAPTTFHTYPGRHFYLFDRIAEICDQITLDLTRARTPQAA